MASWLRGFLEHLSHRLMSVLSAKLEAQLQMELAEVRAELHERAAEYRGSLMEGGTSLATPLLELSERIGSIDSGSLERLEHEPLSQQPSDHSKNSTVIRGTKPQSQVAEGSSDRKRGRPRKLVDASDFQESHQETVVAIAAPLPEEVQ